MPEKIEVCTVLTIFVQIDNISRGKYDDTRSMVQQLTQKYFCRVLLKGSGFLFPTNGILCHLVPKFLFSLEEPILNIFNHEKKLIKADDLYVKNKQKKNNSSACTGVLEKYFQNNFKNAKFYFFDFHQNINLEVVLPTSKYKK